MNKSILFFFLLLAISCQKTEQKNQRLSFSQLINPSKDTILALCKKKADVYAYNGKTNTIIFKEKMDSVYFNEDNPFYDNDNTINFETRRHLGAFINSFEKQKYIKKEDYISDTVYIWNKFYFPPLEQIVHLEIGVLKQFSTFDVAISIKDTLGLPLRLSDDTMVTKLTLFFQQKVDKFVTTQKQILFREEEDIIGIWDLGKIQNELKPLNYEEICALIPFHWKNRLDWVELMLEVDDKGKVINTSIEYASDTLCAEVAQIFAQKLQFPTLLLGGKAKKYEQKMSFDFCPNGNNLEKALFDSLVLNSHLPNYTFGNDVCGIRMGNLFDSQKKHALIWKNIDVFVDYPNFIQVSLYEWREKKWLKKNDKLTIGIWIDTLIDCNFDGYNDLISRASLVASGTTNTTYRLFLYDAKSGLLKEEKDFSEIIICAATFDITNSLDKKEKKIYLNECGGNYGTDIDRIFQWENEKLVLREEVHHSYYQKEITKYYICKNKHRRLIKVE